MTTRNTHCMYSSIRNRSGARKKFSFLPPHGRELAIQEEFVVFGSIYEAVLRGERVTSKRYQDALEDAVARGDIEIVRTPTPILETPSGDPLMLVVADGGNLTTDLPCFTSDSVAWQ